MKLSLVTEADSVSPCIETECELDRAFDQKILRISTDLARSAFETYPDLVKRFGKFEFVIAEKANPGSVSNASGKVVIFRGIQKLGLGDEALAFLIAREMGHVISRHHEENSATRIMFTVLAAIFIPASNMISGSAALVQTASTSTITSAASYIGSRLTIENNKLDQLHEADAIALNLMGKLGWKRNDIADVLISSTQVMGDDSWSKGLRASAEDAVRLADAQNNITGLDIDADGKTLINAGVVQPQAGFTANDPPRTDLDFFKTANGLATSVQDFPEGDLHGTNTAKATGRTRLVVSSNGCYFITPDSSVRVC
jgi:hypothetical protein